MQRSNVDRLHGLARSTLLRSVLMNCSARGLAILGLALAAIVVARVGGPSAVGSYALLRMLPSLLGILCVAGLPGALAYFLADRRRGTPHLWPTLFTVLAVGSLIGALLWIAFTPLIADAFFPSDSAVTIMLAGPTVATQMFLTTSKTALQGLGYRRGSDVVIAAEELAFLPCYAVPLLLHVGDSLSIIVGLGLADVLVGIFGWWLVSTRAGWSRTRRLGAFLRGCRPDLTLAREVLSYGMRGQVGGFLTLMNLRLDFVILGGMAGPAVLGTYAIASKFAELLRLPGIAITWVTYPRFAGLSAEEASLRARKLITPTLTLVILSALPLLLISGPVIRLLYGSDFGPAIWPARVLVVGMLLNGASGVSSGYLFGRGRPGLNSMAMAAGLSVTLILDLLLIPTLGAMGAAIASTTAYLLTDSLLIWLLIRTSGSSRQRTDQPRSSANVEAVT